MNIIDRKKEIETIREHIRRGKSLHIFGPEGTGKSALIDYVYRNWYEIGTLRIPIYCENSDTLEQILDTIAKFLLVQGKKLVDIDCKRRTQKLILQPDELSTVPRRYLRNMVFPHIKRGKFCIILDHLENITPRTNSFLNALYGCASVITASRESWDKAKMTNAEIPEYELWRVPKLEVGNLEKESAFNLMESLLYKHTSLKSSAADSRRLFEDTYAVTRSNPKLIKKIFDKAMDQKYHHDSIQK